MELSSNDIDLLQRFHKQKTTYRLNESLEEIYGKYYLDRISTLEREGYIRITNAEESLYFLKVAELKEILRQNGQKLSGKKIDLIDRIQDNIAQSEYETVVSPIWYLTKKGKEAVAGYIQQNNERYLNQCLKDKDWGLVRNAYLNFAQTLYKERQYDDALPFFLLVKYLDYSGLENNNTVAMYGDMSWISSTNIAYSIEKCLRRSTTDLDVAFQKAIDMCPPIPFHYFAKETVLEIIQKEMGGYEFNPSEYQNVANKPSFTTAEYQYYDLTNLDKTLKAVNIKERNHERCNTIVEQRQTLQDSFPYRIGGALGGFIGNFFAKIFNLFK